MELLSTLIFVLLAKLSPLFAANVGDLSSRSVWAPLAIHNIYIGHPRAGSEQSDVGQISHTTHLTSTFSQINISKELEVTISRLEQILTGRLDLREQLPGSPPEPSRFNPPSHLATVSDSNDKLADAITSVTRNNTLDITNGYAEDSRGDLLNIMPTKTSEAISQVKDNPSESSDSLDDHNGSYPELIDMNTSSHTALVTNVNTEDSVTSTTADQDRRPDAEVASPASTVPESQTQTIEKTKTAKVQLVSPCPGVFSYVKSTPGKERWSGKFSVETNETKFDLDIELNKAAHYLGAWVGEVSSYDNIRYTIKGRTENIQPGSPIEVKIFVKYSSEETDPPILKSIVLNGRQICPAVKVTNVNTVDNRKDPVSSTTATQDQRTAVEETSPASTVPETQALTISKPKIPRVQLVSPCPDVFSYIKSTPGKERWNGKFFVETNETKFDLDIELNKAAHYLAAWVGEVSSYDNIRYTIKGRTENIQPGSPLEVKMFVKYSSEETDPPILKSILLNGRQICPAVKVTPPPKIPVNRPVVSSPSEKEVTSNFGDEIPEDTEYVDGVACGRVEVQATPFITHGRQSARGQWPWHAAIYQSEGIDFKYICGASLIGRKAVLTAAHCVTGELGNPVNPESLTVFLGKYHLKLFADGDVQAKQVGEVIVHPEYNVTNFQSDIAILILSQSVQFTPYVRPVCLWDKNRVQLSDVEGHEGVVVGWGYNEHGVVSEELQMAKMPVISQQTCIWSNPQFYAKYGSDKTYCAGFKNGTSVCNGDSGGGMVFPKTRAEGSDETQTWALRGIVSLGVTLPERRTCVAEQYSVFTDVAKFYSWIRKYT